VCEPLKVTHDGFIKGKSAIHLARNFGGRKKNFSGCHFWARGYYVSAAGRDEEIIRKYIREQEQEDRRLEQLKMFDASQSAFRRLTAQTNPL
jgi:putative transposase